MTCKIKRRSLRCGGRPKADFGSLFTTFIAPALGVAGSVADSAISKTQVSKSNTKPAVKETNTEVTNNTSVENLPTIQVPTKDPISGLVTSNTVIPPDPTKTPIMRLGGRKKCWIGAAIGAATSIAGSLFGAAAQKREMRRQKSIQDWQNTTQEAANMTTALNNSQDYQEDYLRQFRTAARLGKTLGAKGIYITDGGGATKIGNNTYLLRGGSHEDVNETGQTGIGINVGGNEVEAEGGEVAQKKNGALRIFSAQPILGNGMSPAQAILRGYNKDKVFSQQQAFKKRNGLKDDGTKQYRPGGEVPYNHNDPTGLFGGSPHPLAKMFDISGVTSYGDVKKLIDKKRRGEIPTTQEYLGALSAIPAIGRIARVLNLIGNVADATTFMKDVKESEAKENAYQNKVVKYMDIHGRIKTGRRGSMPYNAHELRKRFGGRAKARIGTEKTYEDENKTNITTSNLNGAEYLSKIISGAIMQAGRLLTENSKDKNMSNNVAQDTYLMPFRLGQGRAFKDAGYDRDYQSEKKRDYGLVQKAVGNENIPIYSRVNNPEKRKELIQIYNPESTYNPNIKYPLIHAAFHPSSLYIDGTNGNVMYKGWDLNDYGTNRGGRGFSSYYGSIRKALANTLDVFGNPTVVTTGYQNVLDNNGKPMNIFKGNYKDDFNANIAVSDFIVKQLLKKENPSFVNEYGMSPIPEVVITAPRKKHKLGGGLTSKDKGSSKHPYPSVSSKDFAGGGRSYPIPTKADAVDALRLAGLHGRSDVKSKVYSKYPSLRHKAAFGDWVRTNRDDNALADFLYESGLFDRESWNTMLRDIHEFTGMGGNPYNTDDNIDAVMTPAFGSSSTRVLSQLSKSPEASYTLKQVLALPTKEMVRKRIAGDISKRISIARAARQSSNFRNYNIARMQAANAEASFSPFANQVRYAEGKPVLVNTNGYYTTAGNTISRNAKNMTSGANPFLYAPRTSNEVLEGLSRVIASAKQGAKNVGQRVGNKFKGTPGQKLSDAYYSLTPMQRAKLKGLTLAATLSIPAGYFVESQNDRNKKLTPVQKDAHGKPISRYIARPKEPVKRLAGQSSTSIVRKVPAQQQSRSQAKKVTPAQKSVVVPKQVNKTVPQYKGNTTKGNYQLHDGETRTINGIKYTRRGNTIINHKTNVAYIYDKNGNYTGQADYSKVGNFNQAFDAARADGRNQFIYRAGKYNNYSTIKETNAKKERLNRIVGARRVAKALGGCSRPVKGMRPKAATGIFVPYNKRYTSIYDAPDYDSDYNGGNVLGNGEVTVTAKRIKPTFMKPNNDAMNIINHPANETPYIPQRHNRSRTIFSGGDYLGLGIDTLAALSTGLVNYNTAGKYVLPDRAPIIQASKLPTTYNVNPEIEEVKRYRDRLTGQTFNNTSSSVAALNRSGAINLDALSNLSKLWATKENEENKMLTEDAKNQQTVAAQNVQNKLARQSEIARIKNEAIQAKGDALNVGLSGLSQAWTNFWTAGRTAYEDDQSRRAMIASSKDATPTRLMEFDFDLTPDVIASLYRGATEDRTKRFYLSRLSPKQRQKYGIN